MVLICKRGDQIEFPSIIHISLLFYTFGHNWSTKMDNFSSSSPIEGNAFELSIYNIVYNGGNSFKINYQMSESYHEGREVYAKIDGFQGISAYSSSRSFSSLMNTQVYESPTNRSSMMISDGNISSDLKYLKYRFTIDEPRPWYTAVRHNKFKFSFIRYKI